MSASASPYLVQKSLQERFINRNKSPIPGSLDFELTERCNNRCIHCYINQEADDKLIQQEELTTSQVKRIVSEAADLGCMTIRYTGGEPLLRSDFPEIYLHTRRCGIAVTLFTNATLITEEIVDLFRKYPPGKPVEITLYGMQEKSYCRISGVPGSFSAAMKGIKRLIEANIPFILKGIRTCGNAGEIRELEDFAAEHCLKGQLPSFSMSFNLRARRDNEKKNERIRKLRATPQEILNLLTRDEQKFKEGKVAFIAKFMKPAGEKLITCGCGNSGTIDAYGMLQPCLLLRHPDVVYDLQNGSLRDALERAFPAIRQIKAKNPEYLRRCARCFLHGLCEQCAAHSWMEHGTLDTPVEYLCEIAHTQARYLGLVKDGENGWEATNWQKRIDRFISSDNKE